MADPDQAFDDCVRILTEPFRFELDIVRETEGNAAAVAIATGYAMEALRFIYSVTGASGANGALEMFRAELAKRHPLLDAVAASEVRQ